MKSKVCMLLTAVFMVFLLTACGEDPEMIRFRKSIDDFCTKVSEIDTSINNIDPDSEIGRASCRERVF